MQILTQPIIVGGSVRQGFTGIDDPCETPDNAGIVVDKAEYLQEENPRVMKPSARMIHAIDTNFSDSTEPDLIKPWQERIEAYLACADRGDVGIRLIE